MKRHHLRQNKTCLNCGSIVQERYCSHCGQENTESKESFSHLIGHFLEDITHYDSKFFTTIKDLIFKPGFLTREYNAGKRMSYLNPIRMYVFISAIFFLVTFSGESEENAGATVASSTHEVNLFRQRLADSLRTIMKGKGIVAAKDTAGNNIYTRLAASMDTLSAMHDSSESVTASASNAGTIIFRLQENKYNTRANYDSIQHTLPDSARDNIVTRYMVRKIIWLTHEKGHTSELIITRDIKHDIPKIMFVLLPLFALFVGFFYTRKKYAYTQHAIFSLHFHSFVFIFLMLTGLVERFLPMDKMWLIMIGVTLLGIFIYLSVALYNAYRQPIWLSLIKAFAISILYSLIIILCVIIVVIASFTIIS